MTGFLLPTPLLSGSSLTGGESNSVSKSIIIAWDIETSNIPVSQSLTIDWNNYAYIEKQLSLIWNVYQTVSQTKQFSWNNYTNISKTQSLSWNITWQANVNAPGYVADFDYRYGLTVVSNKLSQWDERFSNGMSFTQSNDTKRPTMSTTAIPGITVPTGDGVDDEMSGNTAAKDLIRNSDSFTIYVIGTAGSPTNGYMMAALTPGLSTRLSIGQGNNSGVLTVGGRLGDTGSAASAFGCHGSTPIPALFTFKFNGLKRICSIYKNGTLVGRSDLTWTSSGSIPNTAAGAVNLFAQGGTAYWPGSLMRMIVCKGEHSTAKMAEIHNSLILDHGLTRIPLNTNINNKRLVQLIGDSIMAGNIMPAGSKIITDFVKENIGGSVDIVNLSKSGYRIVDVASIRPNCVDVTPIAHCPDGIYTVAIGLNDVNVGLTGAAVYASIISDITAAKTARPGIRIILCTPIGSSTISGSVRTQLVNLRNLIVNSGITDGADAICDFGNLEQFLTGSSTLGNDTNYYIDGIHPTELGTSIMATLLSNTITALDTSTYDYSPANISGMDLWLKADNITGVANGDPVTTWIESISGYSPVQNTSSKKPTFQTNSLNGRSGVIFDGIDDNMDFPVEARDVAKDISALTVFVIEVPLTSANGCILNISNSLAMDSFRFHLSNNVGSNHYVGMTRLDNESVSWAYFGSSQWPINTPALGCFVANYGTNSNMNYSNGKRIAANSSMGTPGNTSNTTPLLMRLGAYVSGAYVNSKLYEMLIINRILTAGELFRVHTYLARYYNIDIL